MTPELISDGIRAPAVCRPAGVVVPHCLEHYAVVLHVYGQQTWGRGEHWAALKDTVSSLKDIGGLFR